MSKRTEGMRIKEAAIKLPDGSVWTGKYHHEILMTMQDAGIDRLVANKGEQGFVTECDLFVRRKPAAYIALQAGQITQIKHPHIGLMSEDLG